ncbi:MAG: esterase family protein [Ruminococcaceae bacterium]|nr:esterase family protein [Oscillospiraceae bacterium]
MAFLQVFFHSEVLRKQVQANVILPQRSRGMIGMSAIEDKVDTYPTLYLLHGMSDDHTIWERRTSIERYASEKGIAVVMPNGDLSWYTDMKNGAGDYFTFMSEELPAVMRDFFPKMSKKREETFIAGLSMGGYGAMKIALRCPDTFGYVASLSGALNIEWLYERHAVLAQGIFGNKEEAIGSDDDVFAVAERLADSGKDKPGIFMWCGTEDGLLRDSRALRELLDAKGYDVVYHESAGNHSWGYWDKWIQDILNWLPIGRK